MDGGDNRDFDPQKALETAKTFAKGGNLNAMLAFFRDLEILTPQWAQRLEAEPVYSPWAEEYVALAGYFILRYWLQAASDYDLVGRVKLAISSCLVIRALGGELLQTAQLYSKEIENDSDNIDALLDGAYTCPALTDEKLLGLLLNP